MRTVAITNLKGGVGKTTTTISLGAGLALKGLRVLLVDVDAQGNLAMALGLEPRRTLYDVLIDGKPIEQCLTSARPNMDLLASDDTLMMAQPLLAQRSDWAHLLGRTLKSVASNYDVALIDCSPSMSVLNASALLAANDVVVPTLLEHLALHGITLLERQLSRLGSVHTRWIVPTMFDSRQRQAHALLDELRKQYGSQVAPPIRVNVRLSEAPALGKTIYEHDPRSRGAADYAALVEFLAHKLRLPDPRPVREIGQRSDVAVTMIQTREPVAIGAQAVRGSQTSSSASETQDACPRCGTLLQRTLLAGYRVRYCNHCQYHRQELVQGVRR
jgi:chromosome partitioning protein